MSGPAVIESIKASAIFPSFKQILIASSMQPASKALHTWLSTSFPRVIENGPLLTGEFCAEILSNTPSPPFSKSECE